MKKLQFIILSVFMVVFMCSCSHSASAPTPDAPNPAINWNGTWTQTDESDTATMVATINDGVIEININAPDGSALYWKGTWPAQVTGDHQSITSVADKAALDASIMGSQADTKVFTYKDDQLSFEFQALGVKRTLHLRRDA